ncbi:MAG: hypothetical protein LQ346_008346 [Caloplaca aetnensis]|nr:MAG: hypothetical protein LQ346_008346 [Caloplaca aetnensis]
MKFNSYHIVSCLAGLGSVLAAPNPTTAKVNSIPAPDNIECSLTERNSQYDDLPNALVAVPLNSYQGVNYGNWVYATQQVVQVGGVESRSSPNRIGTGQTATQTFSPQSPFKALALFDFYFGCAVRANTPAASLATSCTVTLTGYSASTGKAVVTASLKFTPPLSPVAPVPMVQAILPSGFNQKLSKVEFKVPNPLLTIALVDDLRYYLYTS